MNLELLKELSETPAVPGREERLRAIVRRELKGLVDTIRIDAMGNLVGHRKGKGPKVMIAAHMDEIGFYVKFIDAKGFVRLQPVGGFDPRQLFAQRVVVHATGGPLRGVLSYTAKPIHMQGPGDASETPKIENFFVDLGLPSAQVNRRVAIGDIVTMDRTLEVCGDHVIGKAIDNRVGVFVMIEALKRVRRSDVDLYAVATTQEEIGLRGATTSAFAVEPDIGIALDVTLANDFPGQAEMDAITCLGKGVGIKIMDASLICHPKLVEHMRRLAKARRIPHQMEILPRGGTDGGALQRSRGGTASITLSVPTRYIHTVNEMSSRADIESTIRLLAAYLEDAHRGDYTHDG